MTNEMKLLRAFIEAQGFEVEEIAKIIVRPDMSRPETCATFTCKEVIDYKVTKKGIDYEYILGRYLKYINSTYLELQDEPEALEHFTLAELKELRRLENDI